MTQQDTQLEYSVHPDSLLYSGSSESYGLQESATTPSLAFRLQALVQRILNTNGNKVSAKSRRKIDHYERG